MKLFEKESTNETKEIIEQFKTKRDKIQGIWTENGKIIRVVIDDDTELEAALKAIGLIEK